MVGHYLSFKIIIKYVQQIQAYSSIVLYPLIYLLLLLEVSWCNSFHGYKKQV